MEESSLKHYALRQTKEIASETKTMKLKYYIVENVLAGSTYYGVAIEQYDSQGQDFVLASEDAVTGITYSHETIEGITEYLANHTVTPSTLIATLSDIEGSIDLEANAAVFAI